MTLNGLRKQIHDFLRLSLPDTPPPFVIHHIEEEQGYRRVRLQYPGQDDDTIPAYLLLPDGGGPFPAVLVHHQHHGQRHLGKSEVCGLAGDPLQAFGPALARQGLAVLVPDSICFEDRRRNRKGIEADETADVEQHYNEMCYRLLRGDTLMRKVLSDSAQGISLLRAPTRRPGTDRYFGSFLRREHGVVPRRWTNASGLLAPAAQPARTSSR